MLITKGLEQAFGSERSSSAVCVVHHNDVLDSKQMLSDRYGTERVHSTSTSDYNREDRGGRRDSLPLPVRNNFSGVYFAGHRFRHGMRNVHCAGVVTVHNNRPQRDGLLERFPHLGFNKCRLLRKYIGIQVHLALLMAKSRASRMACSRFASFDDGLQVERYIYLKLSLTDTVRNTMEYSVDRMVYFWYGR